MALKGDMGYEQAHDISWFWDSIAVSHAAGGCASIKTAGSGVCLGGVQMAAYAVDPSGAKPLGVLTQKVTSYAGQTRVFRNLQNGEILPGEKCCLIRKGWLVTDMVIGSPVGGNPAYLGASGNFATVQAEGAPKVGRFETAKDGNGYAKVWLDIQ